MSNATFVAVLRLTVIQLALLIWIDGDSGPDRESAAIQLILDRPRKHQNWYLRTRALLQSERFGPHGARDLIPR